MATLIVPALDEKPWPTLGPQVCQLIEERAIFGPGDLKGDPAWLSDEKRAIIYRAYEVYPKGHKYAGRRRFKRVGWSVRKGLAKTELQAWVCYAELHPEGPVRCDGFDANGDPVGRPVNSPYIPMLAYNKDQVEELAYGVLKVVCEEGPDADLFDVSLDRVLRLSERGRDDGKALPLAQSPNANDGALTTFQAFDEPHRMYLPRLRESHDTMTNNLPKRPTADAWSFYVGTAGQLGQKSIAEDLYHEAEDIRSGKIKDSRFFFFHRDAGQVHRGEPDGAGHDITTDKGRIAAITEATGPEGEWGPGQFSDIAEIYDRPQTDKSYWERVQLNLWLQANRQAFDPVRQRELIVPGSGPIAPGSVVTAGFDGARFRDATAIVVTDVLTGRQMIWGLWERPLDLGPEDEWEVPEDEVTASVEMLMLTYSVWRFNGDPAHWTETLASWAGRHTCVEEYWTLGNPKKMAYACRAYRDGMNTGAVKYADDDRYALNSPIAGETLTEALSRHIAAAGRVDVNLWDDQGRQLWVLNKIHESRKFDACMAAILSWEAHLAALAAGVINMAGSQTVKRLY